MKTYTEIAQAFHALEASLSVKAKRFHAFYMDNNLQVFRPESVGPIGLPVPEFSEFTLQIPPFAEEGQEFQYRTYSGNYLFVPAAYMEDPEAWEKNFLKETEETKKMAERLVDEFLPQVKTEMPHIKPVIRTILAGAVTIIMYDTSLSPTDKGFGRVAKVTKENKDILKANNFVIGLELNKIYYSGVID